MIKYLDSLTLLAISALLLSTLFVQIPQYSALQSYESIQFRGPITAISQTNKTSLLQIESTCIIPVRVFHQIPYNFTEKQIVSGYGELTKEKEIIAQKLIAQTQVIR